MIRCRLAELLVRGPAEGVRGETGATAFLRLLSFILLRVGVSTIWGGITELVKPLVAARK